MGTLKRGGLIKGKLLQSWQLMWVDMRPSLQLQVKSRTAEAADRLKPQL